MSFSRWFLIRLEAIGRGQRLLHQTWERERELRRLLQLDFGLRDVTEDSC
uniref:Uncharacterized protein n=1 Tax=Rhizophora mucronata TaxID=61149 RepID=A0A2P2NQG7_RHIMU